MEGYSSIKEMSNFHLLHGTTTLLPTTWTSSFDNILKTLKNIDELINDENKLKSDITSLFKLNWNYGIAASIAILISLMIFFNPLEYTNTELVSVDFNGTEEELLADETMIESLFVDDSEFDDWFEERYVLNTVN